MGMSRRNLLYQNPAVREKLRRQRSDTVEPSAFSVLSMILNSIAKFLRFCLLKIQKWLGVSDNEIYFGQSRVITKTMSVSESSLQSLEKTAQKMNCRVVHVLVPNDFRPNTLPEIIEVNQPLL
jgi:hypothetical protein